MTLAVYFLGIGTNELMGLVDLFEVFVFRFGLSNLWGCVGCDPDAIKDAIYALLIENKRIANPDGAMLQKIRKLAGLSEIDSSLAGRHLNSQSSNTTTSKKAEEMRAKKALDQAPTGLYSSTIKPPLHNNLQSQENNLENSQNITNTPSQVR